MGLVSVDDPASLPPVTRAAAVAAPDGARWVGWQEDGTVLAAAAVSRRAEEIVTVHGLALAPEGTAEHGAALLDGLADAVNARALDAQVPDGELEPYVRAGFAVGDPSQDGRSHCTRELDATSDPRPRPAFTLGELDGAIRRSWCADTSSSPGEWNAENPARNQCDVTALLVRSLLGGDILIANVIKDGRRLERHAWNLLPSGIEVDLTRCQYHDGEELSTPTVSEPLGLGQLARRFELLEHRVRGLLAP